jgi:SOS response regulatory protein OraA/RecX
MDEIFTYALKLLARRDYSIADLREKLESRFGEIPGDVIDRLIQKKFLNERQYVENYISRRKARGKAVLRAELEMRGVPKTLIDEALAGTESASLRDALNARMIDWKLGPPLQTRDAARLFRALARLGYDEDAIREEIEHLHEQ